VLCILISRSKTENLILANEKVLKFPEMIFGTGYS